ncbi:MAG TPA: S1 family peptidase [Micromonosporaceae bacterium]
MNPIRYVSRPLTVAAMVMATALAPLPATASPVAPSQKPADVSPAAVAQVLDREARIPGTAWGVEVSTGQVVVSHDDTVTGAGLARLRSVAQRFGDAVRITELPGTLGIRISGADPIYSGSSRCTLGFNVRNSAGTQYFLTAGHCTNTGSTWYANSGLTTVLGSRAGSSFPGNDYGIVRYTNTSISKPGNVNLHNGTYRDITGAGNPPPGQPVCVSGPVGGYRCGSIVSVNNTVNYPQGTVYGLVRTNICVYPGESGAPVFSGTIAVGIVSGGSGSCSTGGYSYYQPVTEPLSGYGVSVY